MMLRCKVGIKRRRRGFEDNLRKAEEFNECFVEVGKRAFEESQKGVINGQDEQMEDINLALDFNFRPTPETVETVILVIKDLRETKAYGADNIELCFIIDSLIVIAFYLTIIINTSIVTGGFPKLWKFAHVIPGYKKGDPEDVGNFRPISLLPVLSKILEKILAKQLMNFLESNKLLCNMQHGFRANLSTETALLKVTNEIYKNMDKNQLSVLSLCDLSKAFDSVNHKMLLTKMKNLNIDPFWFQDYLSNRT